MEKLGNNKYKIATYMPANISIEDVIKKSIQVRFRTSLLPKLYQARTLDKDTELLVSEVLNNLIEVGFVVSVV